MELIALKSVVVDQMHLVRKKNNATPLSENLVKSLIGQVIFLSRELQSKKLIIQNLIVMIDYTLSHSRKSTTRTYKDPTPFPASTHFSRKNFQKNDVINIWISSTKNVNKKIAIK